MLRAMRSVCDIRDGCLTFREFRQAYERLGYSQQVRSVWFLLDKNLSGDISLEELDPVAFRLLKRFRDVLVQKYGSLASAWRHSLDIQKREVVPFRVFLETVQNELGVTYDEADLLFKCLDLNMLGTVSFDEIEFLDDWAAAERKFSRRRGERWVNRDPAGIIDWENRPSLDFGSEAPRHISDAPQVIYAADALPPAARNEDRGGQVARSFSLSPRGSQMGRSPRQPIRLKSSKNKTSRLPAIK